MFEMTDFSELSLATPPFTRPIRRAVAELMLITRPHCCCCLSSVVSELEALGCDTVVRKPLGTQELEGQTLVSSRPLVVVLACSQTDF